MHTPGRPQPERDARVVIDFTEPPPPRAPALGFRRFVLLPAARLLLRDGRPVEIGSRAFDLLHVLLRARGRIVERADLMRQVWPTTTVEESNLRFQVSRLRRALGDDRDLLKTIPGRGYLLAADAPTDPPPPEPGTRDRDEQDLRALLRLVLCELRAGSPRDPAPAPDA
ncbi:transcriptional regulator [Phenylobacterium sp.]|uniref:winged helix-turn-helix domain-containing protein n=1 Tax=Phenylobacterium sp. TaxID=1871053 RepID=UPI0035B0FA4F